MTEAEPFAELRRGIEDYPRQAAALAAECAEAAGRTVVGRSHGDHVEVLVTGAGRIQSVRVSREALRTVDSRALGEWVRDAINDGLDHAEAMMSAVRADDPAGTTDAAFERFEQRMDQILEQLDQLDRRLGPIE